MSAPTNGFHISSARPPVRSLLIVARDQGDLYEALQYAYSDSATISVFLDRRRAERRRSVQPVAEERRRNDRRSLLSIADDLRFQQYLLVRPHYRRPYD